MDVTSNDNVCLMIIEKEKTIVPVALSAFQVAQSSKRKLNSNYKGALIITSNGVVRQIRQIDVLGFWGKSIGRKIVSILSGAYEIKVHFGDVVPIDLNMFKSLVIQYIEFDSKKGDPYLPQKEPIDVVFERLKKANSFAEVFQQINIPTLENCLDVL